jgi:hypothetical protein
MATTSPVTIKLDLPYPLRPVEAADLERGKQLEGFARNISEMFIMRALTAVHGAELDRKAARMWAKVKRELDKGEGEIQLDGTLAEWLFEMFFSTKAEESTKINPVHAVWWFQWLDALEEARAAMKAEAA